MLVEAKREIPWTKPDDIPYAADRPLPKLGGWFNAGFNAAFADGHVVFLPDSHAESVIRAFITKAGAELVPQRGSEITILRAEEWRFEIKEGAEFIPLVPQTAPKTEQRRR